MNRIVRRLRIGGAIVVAVVAITATYLGLSFWTYGSDTQKGPDLPEWFTAGFDYAVDETPLRRPVLRMAEWMGLRERHERFSEHRRIRAWLIRRGFKKGSDVHADAGWNQMHAYYASREASFFPSSVAMNSPTAESDEDHSFAFGKDWEELKARHFWRQAQQRCQE